MTVTLEKLNADIQEIKIVLHRLAHVVEEDFVLSPEAEKELKEARSAPLSEYVDHEEVLKEFE